MSRGRIPPAGLSPKPPKTRKELLTGLKANPNMFLSKADKELAEKLIFQEDIEILRLVGAIPNRKGER